MTQKNKSRNASCVPFRGRGPRSGEGVDGGNPDYDTRCGRDCRRWPSGPWCQGLCRKVASLRSGGRRLAVRKTIEYQIGALPRTPFPAAREFAPVGSMSLDSRVAGLPYESSSFATPTSWGTIKLRYAVSVHLSTKIGHEPKKIRHKN